MEKSWNQCKCAKDSNDVDIHSKNESPGSPDSADNL